MKVRNVLHTKKDFDKVYKSGQSKATKYLVVLYRKNGLGTNRISFLASKKVGNSVQRNRARRVMKEAYRLTAPDLDLKTGFDLVIVARKSIGDAKTGDVMKVLAPALRKTGVVR